ncbi:MAG: efflux RND transporter periplasmic adaptor subunit, partial [Alphaproteobacteria bacterium]|nr:efflux RND transporter periplasmic adaptor subunit [Alphaproteobacteria bacterium]
PAEAVLYGGMGAYVIEDAGDGYFRPVMVETGITASGLTEITSGLSYGQKIVKSGQFMLDAESNLKGGMAAMGHDHGGMTETQEPQGHGQH